MSWIADLLKDIPISGVLKEKLALIEFMLSETEKQNATLESHNALLRKEKADLQAENQQLKQQVTDLEGKVHDLTHIDTLDETKEKILLALSQYRGACYVQELEIALPVMLHAEGKPPLDVTTIEYHLHDLDQQSYIKVSYGPPGRVKNYSLKQKGREYLIKNNLL